MTGPRSGDPWRIGDRLAGCVTSVLGDAVAGVILHGSATTDDFRAGRSDVDVLVISEGPVDDSAAGPLLDGAAAIGRGAGTNVDLRIVTRAAAGAPERLPELELEVAVRPGRQPAARIETRRASEPDLLVEYWICRQHGRALVGPDPADLIGPVPVPWVVEVSAAQLERWLALAFEPKYAELMVFTACRVWYVAAEGRHSSKTAAAQWSLGQRPALEVVRAALERRARGADLELPEEQVRALLSLVLEQELAQACRSQATAAARRRAAIAFERHDSVATT